MARLGRIVLRDSGWTPHGEQELREEDCTGEVFFVPRRAAAVEDADVFEVEDATLTPRKRKPAFKRWLISMT